MKTSSWRVLISTLILALVLSSGAYAGPILSGESYRPVVWGPSAVSSEFVEYSIDAVSSGGSDRGFVNVVRDDGTWVVQNLPVGFEPGLRRMATNIASSLFQSGSSYATIFSTALQTEVPAFAGGVVQTLGATVQYLANNGFGRTDAGAFVSPGDPSNIALTFGDIVGFSWHTGMPDLAQGKNECGPTSAANSLTWLNEKFDLGLGKTTEQIRDILKDLDHMKTDPEKGTTDANFLKGKDAFLKGVPVNTHVIEGGAGGPSIANILKEMEKGQDVELAMAWGNGGGHWVTLVGIIDLGPLGAGIGFNDPDDGKNQTNWSWLDGDNGFSIRSYGKLNGGNVVDFAVAESVPEPGTLVLVTLGAIGLICYRPSRTGRRG